MTGALSEALTGFFKALTSLVEKIETVVDQEIDHDR